MSLLLRARAALSVAFFAACLAPPPGAAAPPEEGECPTLQVAPTSPGAQVDALPVLIEEGMILDQDDLLILQQLIPPELWRHREAFFFEGMRIEVGPCHRRYPLPGFFGAATEKFHAKVRLDKNGNLRDFVAGLPFPPESIDPESPDAAIRWAWNLEQRYRGAGYAGRFRITDLPSRLGGIQVYRGDFFLIQTSHRSDLDSSNYKLREAENNVWIFGGRFLEPFNARHLAWRQFRPTETRREYKEPDDTFVYVPTMRKMRRAATTWVDGLFLPRYSVAGDGGGGGMPFGTGGGGPGGSINPTAGQSIAVSEDMRRGFTGLSLRPNAYVWRLLGERDVLAPLNGNEPGFPILDDRNFGPSGLSVASDRWDVRRAVIIEGATRVLNEDVRTVMIYVDYQTQQPLFWITRTQKRRLLEVGILVHRFSADIPDYPEWPGGTPTLVFEPVAASFYNVFAGGGGWRRESYDTRSLPFSANERRRMTSSSVLDRGR